MLKFKDPDTTENQSIILLAGNSSKQGSLRSVQETKSFESTCF